MSRFTIAILAAALALAAPLAAYAAGLGRLTVWSPLGQPLDAEIEIVSLQSGEEQGLSARIAPIEAFRQAGIEPSGALVGARLTVERRDGRSVIRIRTAQPVSEPFLDLLVELQWTNGRLVREYTFLLDPPEYKGPQTIAAAPVTKPAAPEAQPLPPVEAKPETQPVAAEPAKEPAVAAAAPAAPGAATYEVQRGDTLAAIARQNLPPGVSLNQMLIAIYRANQDAFIRENINLVRTGRILNIPDAESIGTITADEASGLVQTHRTEFDEYRTRLAAAPTRADETPGQRAVAGQIEAKPEAPAPGEQQEQLRLSKADPQKPAAPGSRAASEDDAVARERALKEAQSRVADLEKNVADLQKLLELKNQQLAELEKRATAKPAPAVPAPAPVKPGAEAVAPTAAPEAATPAPEAARPAPATIPPKPAAVPEAKKAEPAPKPKPKAAPPPPAPSLIDEFLDNPIALAGLALVILLLVGYGYWSWRRKKATQTKFQDSVLGAAAGAAFGAAAGGAAVPAAAQPAAGVPEEVDPIAEADVYMAYGRDAQAEEILKEALQKDAHRVPVHTKLLEIYASRRDARAFEQTALKVKSLTGGSGPEWEKAATLGRSVDPQNGLYAGAPGAPAGAPTASVPAAAAAAAAPTLDFDLGGATTPGTGSPDITLDEGNKTASAPSVDFDLGAATTPAAGSDFSPGGTLIMGEKKSESPVSGLDFDLDIGGDTKPGTPAAPAPSGPADSAGGLDFDLNLDLGGGEKPEAPEKPAAAPMDLSSISLDLGSAGEPLGTTAPSNDPKWQEVATKLDLAKAYEEMGDKDGARELLNEVMKDGDASQKGQAQQLLTKLG